MAVLFIIAKIAAIKISIKKAKQVNKRLFRLFLSLV